MGNVKYKVSKSFGAWFDENGALDTKKFETCINEGLEVVKSGEKPHDK
jgi:hypothetical protein